MANARTETIPKMRSSMGSLGLAPVGEPAATALTTIDVGEARRTNVGVGKGIGVYVDVGVGVKVGVGAKVGVGVKVGVAVGVGV